jgi:predicted nucleic acid-binding protein
VKFVIDTSFIAALLLPDESADRATARLREIKDGGAVAPSIWQLEVTNFLLMAERRRRIDASQFSRLIEAVDALPVTLQPALTVKQRGEMLHYAHKHRLTTYDAVYLELALRLDLPLATLDNSLRAAAKAEGAKLVD